MSKIMLKKIRLLAVSAVCAGLLTASVTLPLEAKRPGKKQELPEIGKVIGKVNCRLDNQLSYALYIPSNFTEEKRWPVLFAFDAWARGPKVVELYRGAAEKYGFIVAASNDSRNGPPEPIKRAINAVWYDIFTRFPVDKNRVYATGFSGGARVSSFLHLLSNSGCAGIIAVGAGLSLDIKKPEQMKGCNWYGIVGLADYNYRELMTLDQQLTKAGVQHFVDIIEGGHRWPEQVVVNRAVEWMIADGMKKGTWPMDKNLAELMFQKSLGYGRQLEYEGKAYFASRAYGAYQKLFNGLVDSAVTMKAWSEKLRAAKEYKKFLARDRAQLKEEKSLFRRFGKVLYTIENPVNPEKPVPLNAALKQLALNDLFKESKDKKHLYERSHAERILYDLGIKSGRRGDYYLEHGDYGKAWVLLEIATRIGTIPFIENRYFNLARVYAERGDKERALRNLKQAVKLGFKDREQLQKDPHLDSIRNDKEFKKLVSSLG